MLGVFGRRSYVFCLLVLFVFATPNTASTQARCGRVGGDYISVADRDTVRSGYTQFAQ